MGAPMRAKKALERLDSIGLHYFLFPMGAALIFFGLAEIRGLPPHLIAVGLGLIVWAFRPPRRVWNPLTGYYEDREENSDKS